MITRRATRPNDPGCHSSPQALVGPIDSSPFDTQLEGDGHGLVVAPLTQRGGHARTNRWSTVPSPGAPMLFVDIEVERGAVVGPQLEHGPSRRGEQGVLLGNDMHRQPIGVAIGAYRQGVRQCADRVAHGARPTKHRLLSLHDTARAVDGDPAVRPGMIAPPNGMVDRALLDCRRRRSPTTGGSSRHRRLPMPQRTDDPPARETRRHHRGDRPVHVGPIPHEATSVKPSGSTRTSPADQPLRTSRHNAIDPVGGGSVAASLVTVDTCQRRRHQADRPISGRIEVGRQLHGGRPCRTMPARRPTTGVPGRSAGVTSVETSTPRFPATSNARPTGAVMRSVVARRGEMASSDRASRSETVGAGAVHGAPGRGRSVRYVAVDIRRSGESDWS